MLQPATRTTMDSLDLWSDLADDIWQVRMPNGALLAMSIEELDAAFSRGELDLDTLVQRPSGGDWMTVGEAAGLAGDSITPMAVATEVRANIPRPPPLPRRPLQSLAEEAPLSDDELRVVGLRPGRAGQVLGALGGVALLVGGLVAWHFMPTHPVPSLTTTTITAPPSDGTALGTALIQEPAPESTNPPEAAPETSPAPEGNALTEATPTPTNAVPPPAAKASKKAAPAKKKPALSPRGKPTLKKHA